MRLYRWLTEPILQARGWYVLAILYVLWSLVDLIVQAVGWLA